MVKIIMKNKPLSLCLAALIGLASNSLYAQVCPAGSSADTLDWSALWNPAWNGTAGPHTMTTTNGVDITFSLAVAGAGCSFADLAFGDPFINNGALRLAANWPNNNCSMTMQLDFSVGAPINVQQIAFTASDVDFGNNSWDDSAVFNGSDSATVGANVTAITDGGEGNNLNCTAFSDPRCEVRGTWNGPLNSVSFTYSNGAGAPANPGGQLIWVEDVTFCYPDTVPVTLGAFKSNRLGDRITANWQTVSESFNVGFTLWGNVAGEWVALSDRMVRSKATDTTKVSRYRSRVNVRQFDEDVSAIGLSSIDTNGTEEFYGPFDIGKSYGLDSVSEAIKWQPIRDAYERKLAAANYESVGQRWRKRFVGEATANHQLSLSIPQAGIYKITHAEMLAKGLDLTGVPNNQIAVSFKGKPVARDIVRIERGRRSRNFGPGSAIVFYGGAPTGDDALYLDSLVYQISQNSALVAPAGHVRHKLQRGAELQTLGQVTQRIEQDKFYDELVSSDDPWMMDELFVFGASASKTYEFEFNGAASGTDVELFAQLNSITDFDPVDQDGDGRVDDEHHIQIIINEQSTAQVVLDETNDGVQSWQLKAQFSDALLKQGTNTVTIKSVGDTGYDFSLVYIDALEVTLSEPITVQNSALPSSLLPSNVVQFSGVPQDGGFVVPLTTGDLTGRLYGYAYTDAGNLARVRIRRARSFDGQRSLRVSGISETDLLASYWLANQNGFLSADGVWLSDQNSIDIQQNVNADYLLVIDPALVGADIQRFINYREESGFDVAMFTTDQIVDQFGFGMKTPDAFAHFLRTAKQSIDYNHVLLVGGHTYDYRNRLQAEVAPVNMIPTFYRRTYNIINFSPTDLPFVDFDGSGKPSVALGRWPVRTADELQTIIDKTIAYEKPEGMAEAQKALLIAERKGSGLEDFTAQLGRIETLIGNASGDQIIPWSQITRIDVDAIEAQGFAQGTAANSEARRLLKEGIDDGQSLTIFAGHGSPTRWSNQNLFTWNNITELDNIENPTQVSTLACYTTYYQSPSTNSLAHQFLFDSAGAVSINGASVLGSIGGNEALLKVALENMMQPGVTMGQAVMQAKRQLIDEQRFQDTVVTWVTLGDPALMIRQ